MTQEEKQLLLKDLCGRLPYRVKINCFDVPRTLESISIDCDEFITIDCGGEHFYHPLSNILHKDCLPYLRSLSSMTEEEKIELCIRAYASDEMKTIDEKLYVIQTNAKNATDFYNEHHIDYRGLIPMGLALEAPEEMYVIK